SRTREFLFWILLGGFVWVIGDVFQQYAAKYIGISRGIPLSNTNQLWGLLWGIFVFGELRGLGASHFAQVVGGSVLMALGAAAIALSSVPKGEHSRWREAALRESQRYRVDSSYVDAGLSGQAAAGSERSGRSWLDWILIAGATAVFVRLAMLARVPHIEL